MERVNGTLNESPKPKTCMPIGVGDFVYHVRTKMYAIVREVDERGKQLRLGYPLDYVKFCRWCAKNPHRVKRLRTGFIDH